MLHSIQIEGGIYPVDRFLPKVTSLLCRVEAILLYSSRNMEKADKCEGCIP